MHNLYSTSVVSSSGHTGPAAKVGASTQFLALNKAAANHCVRTPNEYCPSVGMKGMSKVEDTDLLPIMHCRHLVM